MRNPLSDKVINIKPSGIRKFFDIVSEMKDAISLGVGEPDFETPWHIRDEGIYSLEKGKTSYTSNAGLKELKECGFKLAIRKLPVANFEVYREILLLMDYILLDHKKIDITKAKKVPCGSLEECNKRVINQYIHPEVMKSCQLAMGLTQLEVGSNWNTMPCHTHDRRMEVYLYLDMDRNDAVFHMMGEPKETRHIIMHNEEAVISPSWSIHSGVGTKNYSFIWAMCGENQEFTDMDHIETKELR